LPAIPEPHQGTSYNPPDDAHKDLLVQAYNLEEKRLKEEEKLAELRQKMDQANASVVIEGVPAGMFFDEV
jgi:nucleolar protein 53